MTDIDARAAAGADFAAASREFDSNVEVRRLMIVVVHVLVPGLAIALVNTMCGASYPEALAWLPRHMPWIAGSVLAVAGVWTSAILARCHFGLVVNGGKLRKVRDGELRLAGLNWLGVTTNFLLLTAVAGVAGVALVAVSLGRPWWGLGLGIAWLVLPLVWLGWQHLRANRLCRRLDPSWQSGQLSAQLREDHVRRSLDATSADISIVVTMAAALFAGCFDAWGNLGSLAPAAVPAGFTLAQAQQGFALGLGALLAVGLLLSARIVVRLRIALAQHAAELARLRDEPDDPWRFDPRERTFLLFLVVVTLAVVAALMFVWTLAGPVAGGVAAGCAGLASLVWYPLQLARARRRARRQAA